MPKRSRSASKPKSKSKSSIRSPSSSRPLQITSATAAVAAAAAAAAASPSAKLAEPRKRPRRPRPVLQGGNKVHDAEAADIERSLMRYVVEPLQTGGHLNKLFNEGATILACDTADLTVREATQRVQHLPRDESAFAHATQALGYAKSMVLSSVCGPPMIGRATSSLDKICESAKGVAEELRVLLHMTQEVFLATDSTSTIKQIRERLRSIMNRFREFETSAASAALSNASLISKRQEAFEAIELANAELRRVEEKWVLSEDQIALGRLTKDLQESNAAFVSLVDRAHAYLDEEGKQLEYARSQQDALKTILADAPIITMPRSQTGWFINKHLLLPALASLGETIESMSMVNLENTEHVNALFSARRG